MNKIEQGWSFGEVRDDNMRKNPSLTNFEKLPKSEKKYVVTVAFETLRSVVFVTLIIKPYNLANTNLIIYSNETSQDKLSNT